METWKNGKLVEVDNILGYAVKLKRGMWLRRREGKLETSAGVPKLFDNAKEANICLGEALVNGLITFNDVECIQPIELRELTEPKTQQ